MATKRQHFAEFFSPGTLFSESSTMPLESWDTRAAVELANGITERHGAKPFGFQFVTKIVHDAVPDGEGGTMTVAPKEVERSGTHYLGGRLLFYHEVPDDEKHSILRSNMRGNRMPICIENRNSYLSTNEFKENACIVEADGRIARRGTDGDLVEYRKEKLAEFEAETKRELAEWEERRKLTTP